MSSGVSGAKHDGREISNKLIQKQLLSKEQLQKLFYVRRVGWVTDKHIKELVGAFGESLTNRNLKLPKMFLEKALTEVREGDLKYGILELGKVTNSIEFGLQHILYFLETLVKFPIIRELNLAGFASFSVDKVAMAILNCLRVSMKTYTPALLPEEKRAIIRRAKTRQNILEKSNRHILLENKANRKSSSFKYKVASEKKNNALDETNEDAGDKNKMKHTPWVLKEDGGPIYLLQRILFHVTPKISATEMGSHGKNKKPPGKPTRRLSRSVSKVAIEMFGELCEKINELCEEIELGNEELETARRFRVYDKNNMGYIEVAKLKIAVSEMGIACTENEINALVNVLDKNSDNHISEREFVKIVSFKTQKHITSARVDTKYKQLLVSSRYLLHPNSKIMQYWDIILLSILVFLAFSVPVECAFLEPDETHPLFIVNRIIDVFLFFDIVAHFFLMYPKKDHDSTWCETWERSHEKIAWNYISSWFLIDFVSFIPYDVFLVNSNNSSMNEDLNILRWLKLLRLLRLVKLVKVIAHGRIIEKIKLYLDLRHSYQMIFWLISVIVFVIHFLACMWMMSVAINAQTDTLYTTWYVQGNYGFEWPPDFKEMYPICLYWAVQTVTTIGYGDAGNPTNYSERILATLAMLLGSILWAYLISMITTIIHFSQKTQLEHHQMMELLDQFVVEKGFDAHLKLQLREYYSRRQSLDRMESYQAIMNHLSPSLKGHVAKVLTGPWLEKVSWLRNASEAFITSVALLLKAAIYPPMETMDGTTFHVIVRGVAIKDMMVKCSGMVWGLDMVLANKELRHLSPAIALTYCELLVLPRSVFIALLEKFPLEKTES